MVVAHHGEHQQDPHFLELLACCTGRQAPPGPSRLAGRRCRWGLPKLRWHAAHLLIWADLTASERTTPATAAGPGHQHGPSNGPAMVAHPVSPFSTVQIAALKATVVLLLQTPLAV